MKTETTQLICQHLLKSRHFAQGAMMVGVGVVAIVAAGSWANRSRVTALSQWVESLNEEIARFHGAGGCLAGIRGGEAIIEALKEGGAKIEPRLSVVTQTERQAASNEPRALWEPVKQRFVISEGGEAGARDFNSISEGDGHAAA